jgi:mRNA interferase RelE/StbE
MSSAPKSVVITKAAAKALRKMDQTIAVRIIAKIEQYAADPASLANNVKVLVGMDGVLRLRVGDWRVLFTEDLVIILVLKIAHRSEAYE